MTFTAMIRRQYKRGLMTRLEMQLELGLVTVEEALKESHRLRMVKPRKMAK